MYPRYHYIPALTFIMYPSRYPPPNLCMCVISSRLVTCRPIVEPVIICFVDSSRNGIKLLTNDCRNFKRLELVTAFSSFRQLWSPWRLSPCFPPEQRQ